MSYLVPKSFWSMPSINFPSLLEEDQEWGMMTNSPSGLSLSEDDKNVYVTASVPGIDPKDVDITFERGVLRIVAQTQQEEKEARKIIRRAQSHYSYEVLLPESVDSSADPEARYEKGQLHLVFSKSPKMQPKKITIKHS